MNNSAPDIINTYIERGEKARITCLLSYNGSVYKEVAFEKKEMMGLQKSSLGYIYLNERDEIVLNKNITRELCRLGYFNEIFFDKNSSLYILKALREKMDVEKDKLDYAEIDKALELLQKEEKLHAAEELKKLMIKIFKTKMDMNDSIKELKDILENLEKEGGDNGFNDLILHSAYAKYEEVMKRNFENVKTISFAGYYLDDVKSAATKKRKKWSNRFNSRMTSPLFKLDYQISYFKKVIKTYEPVINMSTPQYMKFFNTNQNKVIEERISKIKA